MSNPSNLVEIAAEIVAAYVSNNSVNPEELPALIQQVYAKLQNVNILEGYNQVGINPQRPVVDVNETIFDDHLICLEDGKQFRSLKRHLWTHYKLTPEQYRAKWGLPADYPMVAPNYSVHRSSIAKDVGLGKSRIGKGKHQVKARNAG